MCCHLRERRLQESPLFTATARRRGRVSADTAGQLLKPLGAVEDIVLRGGSLQRLKWRLRHIFHPHSTGTA